MRRWVMMVMLTAGIAVMFSGCKTMGSMDQGAKEHPAAGSSVPKDHPAH